MIDLFEVLKTVAWGILAFVIFTAIYLSPIGKLIDGFIDELEEFRKWKRDPYKRRNP